MTGTQVPRPTTSGKFMVRFQTVLKRWLMRELASTPYRGVISKRKARKARVSPVSVPCEVFEERVLLSGTSPTANDDNYTVSAGGVLAVTTSANQVEQLNPVTVSGSTGEKPQSKVWSHNGNWWSVFADNSGTYVWRLDGSNWTQVLQLSSSTSTKADVRSINGVAHILMQTSSTGISLRSIEFNNTTSTYEYWSQQPNITTIPNSASIETITLDVDSTGRMWVAYEASGEIRVRYSDGDYSSWSSEIVLATGIYGDDIAAVVAMPGKIGVFWSNQNTKRFGFRTHVDGADPADWSADEIPASQFALDVGSGFADDHMNLEVKADGTLYVAAKTSYDTSGYPRLILLVRRPDGTWDQPYAIDSGGTRPTISVRASTNELIFAYRNSDSSGPIMYRQLLDDGTSITVGAEQVLMDGTSYSNVSSTKDPFNNELVLISAGSSDLATARLRFRSGVLVNDTDVEGDLLTTETIAGPLHGSLVFNANGTFTYTHNGDLATSDTFTYHTWDGTSWSNVATVHIAITQLLNTPPVAIDDAYSMINGGTLNANDANGTIVGTNNNGVLVNDTDADGNSLTAILVSGPAHGSLTLNSNGTFTYTHNGDSATSDSFTYKAYDGTDQGNLATVTISIAAASSTSVTVSFQDGVNGYAGTTDTQIRSGSPTTNYGATTELKVDGSPDIATLIRWDLSSIPANSTVTSATLRLYITNTSAQTFEIYQLLRSWSESQATWNQAATGANWGTAGAQGAADRASTILGSLISTSGGSVTFTLNSAGIAVLQSWINNASTNFGLAIENYVHGDALAFSSSEVATISRRPALTITYTQSNTPTNNPPVANNESYSITAGTTLNANDANGTVGGTNDNSVLVNDTDLENNPLTAVLVGGPTHASSFTLNSNGTFTYTHNGDSATSDTFTYRAFDGNSQGNLATVTITINPVVTQPPSITTTPSALAYTENDAATAIDSGLTTSDPDSTNLTGATVAITGGFASGQDVLGFVNQNGISGTFNATTGVLTLTGSSSIANYQAALRSITYTNTSENPSTTSRTITFSVSDGTQSANASRTINVIAVNDPPVAADDSRSVTKGTTLNANDANGSVGGTNDNGVLANDTDPENNSLTAVLVTGPAHASSFTLNANGTFSYTHNGDSATSDSFTYRAFDGTVEGNLATVTITITPPNPTPVTVSFQDGLNGYTGTTDATIRGDNVNLNSGSVTNLETDGSPDLSTLYRWDTSSIAPGSTVQSASITLLATNSSTETYELYEVLRPWIESQVTWNQAANGVNWSTGGAQGSGDRGTTVLASVTPTSTGTLTITLNSAGIAMVQSWINNPTANHGVILQDYSNSNGFDVNSREVATAANRPKLNITYVAGSPLIADQAAAIPTTILQTGGGSLSDLVSAAESYWLTTTSTSSTEAVRNQLAHTNIQWAHLNGNLLAVASSTTIYLDIDAAGYGWFLDATPGENSEFDSLGRALAGTAADGRMDLLSVLVHEFGHILGHAHDEEGVMHESLSAGTRTVAQPEASLTEIDSLFTGVSLTRELTPFVA